MNGVMHNENDTEHASTPIWYDGQKVRHDKPDESIRSKAIQEDRTNSTARPQGETAGKNIKSNQAK
jgi:hypothetical protein